MAHVKLVHAHYDEAHLAAVVETMRAMGAPVLRAVGEIDGDIYLLEGSHRARAAAQLGLTVRLQMVTDIDFDAPLSAYLGDSEAGYSAAELTGYTPDWSERSIAVDVELA